MEKEQIKEIVEIQIRNLNKILKDRKIQVVLTDKAKEILSEQGFDPDYGARPLKRAIQTYIQNPLSLRILEGDFSEGDKIRVDANGAQGLQFEEIKEVST